jgi:Domain of unknown function (DUF4349)
MTTTDALQAVDEALASGRPGAADPVERELQELALVLRADAPAPDPAFATRMDERVAARFRRPRVARSLLPRRRILLAGAAGVLTVVAVGGAVVGLTGRDERPPQFAFSEAKEPATRTLQAPVQRQAPEGATSGANDFSPLSAPRRVERAAQLTLAAPADRLDGVADQIVQVTDRHRGVVLDSSVSTGSDPARGGSFSLRVPTGELTQTLRDLSRLGQVRSRSESGHDVTRPYVTLQDRLTAARVERRGLLRRLGHATSTSEADRLRSRVDAVSREVQSLRRDLGQLQARTDYTRVSVTLVERPRASGAIGGAGDALRGSLRALVGALAVTLRVVAAVLPFALLGALAWAATAAVRRRRREAVLS